MIVVYPLNPMASNKIILTIPFLYSLYLLSDFSEYLEKNTLISSYQSSISSEMSTSTTSNSPDLSNSTKDVNKLCSSVLNVFMSRSNAL